MSFKNPIGQVCRGSASLWVHVVHMVLLCSCAGICSCAGMDTFSCVDFQHMLKGRFTSVASICIRWPQCRGAGVIAFEKLCPVDRKPRHSRSERCKPSAPVPTCDIRAATYTYSIFPDTSWRKLHHRALKLKPYIRRF